MKLFFSEKGSWGKTTILPLIGTVTINTDGTLDSNNPECARLVDNVTVFDHDNMPEIVDDLSTSELGDSNDSVNMDDYTHDNDVVFSVHDKEILKKSLNFLTPEQLIELVEKAGLNKPKSEKKHVLIQLLYKKMDAGLWKSLLENIFDTFATEE